MNLEFWFKSCDVVKLSYDLMGMLILRLNPILKHVQEKMKQNNAEKVLT